MADSRLQPPGTSGDYLGGDFFLTLAADSLLDSFGNETTIRFTTSPVGADGGAAVVDAADPAALLADYLFVGYPPQAANATADFTIGGLEGTQMVDLWFYGGNVGAVTIPGVDPAPFAATGICLLYTSPSPRDS